MRVVIAKYTAKFAAVIVSVSVIVALAVAALSVPVRMLGDVGSGDPEEFELSTLAQRSYVYAADNSVMATLHDEQNRQPVALADVPQHVIAAILAVEDAGFWVHDGVNARGMLRAFSANLDAGGVSQGGSTITQQLVKLDILNNSDQTLERKAQEIVIALRLEREQSKEQILERYLNTVYFGNGAYGVQAAAEVYFGTGAAELTIDQAAMMAGIIRNPNVYNPIRFPERVAERRTVALQRMVEVGAITEDEALVYDTTPLPTEAQQVLPRPDDYFVTEVRQQLLQQPWIGETYEQREQLVFEGGLKVYTTFDPRAQQQAIAARDANLTLVNGVFAATPDPRTGEPRFGSAALVSIQPDNGAIRTMVGGPGFENYQYNLVMGKRNPGSSFKTFYLAAAFEAGRSTEDVLDGRGPCVFAMPEGQEPYDVTNFDGSSGQVGTLRQLTMQSSNCGYVRLGYILGQQAGVDVAARLGVRSEMTARPSTPLGTADVTPLDMASAYATLANDGNYNPPYMVERVEDRDGNVIYQHQPAPQSVVSPQTARMVSSVLQDNVRAGTGRSAADRNGHPVAGKTGTHQNSTDAWFVGYSMDLATAVWVGGLGSQFEIRLEGRGITGGSFPARIFGDFYTAYHEGRPARAFPGPEARPATILAMPPGTDLTRPPAPPPPPPGQPPTPTIPGFPLPPGPGQPIPGFPGGPPPNATPQNLRQPATPAADGGEQAAAPAGGTATTGAGPPTRR